jgi:uncharacterized protein (TIGR02996 family)
MSIHQQLLADVAAAPEDWKLREVLADWYEDNSQPHCAECLRWMVRHKKRPYVGSQARATWFNADTISTGLGDPESDVPGPVYDRLEGGKQVANHKTFKSTRDAEEAFHQAWAGARQGGWSPGE